MTHWPFILGAYALALVCTLGLTGWSFAAMRRAEREAGTLKDRR
ncbi:MAG TPA: heme exporter protein CcmD [Allosphingosinicella sp.]